MRIALINEKIKQGHEDTILGSTVFLRYAVQCTTYWKYSVSSHDYQFKQAVHDIPLLCGWQGHSVKSFNTWSKLCKYIAKTASQQDSKTFSERMLTQIPYLWCYPIKWSSRRDLCDCPRHYLGKSHICNLCTSISGQQNICRLQILHKRLTIIQRSSCLFIHIRALFEAAFVLCLVQYEYRSISETTPNRRDRNWNIVLLADTVWWCVNMQKSKRSKGRHKNIMVDNVADKLDQPLRMPCCHSEAVTQFSYAVIILRKEQVLRSLGTILLM